MSAHHHSVDRLKVRDDKVAAQRRGVAQRENRQEQPGVEVHLLQQHRQLSRPIPRAPLQLLAQRGHFPLAEVARALPQEDELQQEERKERQRVERVVRRPVLIPNRTIRRDE